MAGIISYGAYVPRYRLARKDITVPPTIGVRAPVKGTRSVAGFDEDTTTMGVEAARAAMNGSLCKNPDAIFFATTNPAYMEKTNAMLIHAALDLPNTVQALDMVGSVRTGAGALQLGLQQKQNTMVVLSDIRAGLAGGADEREGGDAAAAFLVTGSDEPVIAELLSSAVVSEEFLDRWHVIGEPVSRRWEERYGDEVYQVLGKQALNTALEKAGVAPTDVKHLVVGGPNTRSMQGFAKRNGGKTGSMIPDLVDTVGNTGIAHAGILLAGVLDKAASGDVIVVVTLSDGAEAMVFRATELIATNRAAVSLSDKISGGTLPVDYSAYLIWRGLLESEMPRRPDPPEPAAPVSRRDQDWKIRFKGSCCKKCGEQHYPPQRVCQACQSVDEMESIRPLTGKGTVITSVVDRISWSPYPPPTFAVVDLDGGGRARLEVVETGGIDLMPGTRLELTFRNLYTSRNGVHSYFWKMRPVINEKE